MGDSKVLRAMIESRNMKQPTLQPQRELFGIQDYFLVAAASSMARISATAAGLAPPRPGAPRPSRTSCPRSRTRMTLWLGPGWGLAAAAAAGARRHRVRRAVRRRHRSASCHRHRGGRDWPRDRADTSPDPSGPRAPPHAVPRCPLYSSVLVTQIFAGNIKRVGLSRR